MAKSRRRESPKPNRPRAHSLLDRYNGIRHSPRVKPFTIEDPYKITANQLAMRVAPPPGAATDDGPEWQVPARPRLEVLAAVRDDVAANMFARRQIDDACFLAARAYQTTYEKAEALRRTKSVDLSMPPISGAVAQFEGVDGAIKAANELKRIDGLLSKRTGEDGVGITRSVLGTGKTIELVAREWGESTKAGIVTTASVS
jgi:hypothetical protein